MPYLREKNVRIPCVVRPEREALLDEALRVRINHENFLFSSREAMELFEADPFRYLDRLTDPVTRVRFQPQPSSPRLVEAEQTWYFATEESRESFLADPGRHAALQGWMR